MDYLERARRVISLEIEELQQLHERIEESFTAAIELLKSSVEGGGKVVIVGVGKSGNIGSKLAATFNSTGAPSTILNCQDALHGDLGLVGESDAVLALSYSGETAELLAVLPYLKRKGAAIIAITGKSKSTLAQAADCILDIKVTREACPMNLAPTSSTTNTLVIGDALAMVLLESRGFTKEKFAELHPGGSLGRALLLKAGDIMRKGDDCVRVGKDEPIRSVIEQMTKARAGAVVVTNEDKTLAGIFTQGDFARAFQSGQEKIGEQAVSNFMTADPIHVKETQLVGEVLKLLEDHRIDDLVVVNENSTPLGMIDTQDLTRLQVV